MLPIICIALLLRLGHATGRVHVSSSSQWYGRVVAAACTCTEFQQSLVYDVIDQWQRLEACINAEGGHFEHLLWHCLPGIPVATYHNGSFQSHQCQPTTGSFQSTNIWRNATDLHSDEKPLHFTSWCGDIFRCGGQVGYSLFPFEITWIIRSMYE